MSYTQLSISFKCRYIGFTVIKFNFFRRVSVGFLYLTKKKKKKIIISANIDWSFIANFHSNDSQKKFQRKITAASVMNTKLFTTDYYYLDHIQFHYLLSTTQIISSDLQATFSIESPQYDCCQDNIYCHKYLLQKCTDYNNNKPKSHMITMAHNTNSSRKKDKNKESKKQK